FRISSGACGSVIDLHAHTTYSDGTFTPEELLAQAGHCGLTALAVTDHDTLAGFDEAAKLSTGSNGLAPLELVCGIELTTKRGNSSVHVLGYFPSHPPSPRFRRRLHELFEQRMDRNGRLIRKLQSLGLAIELEEVQSIGRYMTGRPHFAQLLV